MNRREILAAACGLTAWPVTSRAQQRPHPVIGILTGGLAGETENVLAAFRKGIGDAGYFEGSNVTIEIRITDANDQLQRLAAELVTFPVDIIFATGNANAALAAKAATDTIPIVFSNGSDPVKLGVVASMNRPGGNITGVSYYTGALIGKRLDLLHKIVPNVGSIGFLYNPTNLISTQSVGDFAAAAQVTGQKTLVFKASSLKEIDTVISEAAQGGIGALVVDVDAFFTGRHERIVALVAQHRIPAIYANRVFPAAGGLISYADNRFESRRLAAAYVGRILKGEKPADLPVLQPTKFELVVNLNAAKALGLVVPDTVLVSADEVIE